MSGSVHEVKGQRPVIFFDAAGTLIRLARPVGHFYSEISSRFGALTSPARMESAFRSVWRELPHRPPEPSGPRPHDDRPWWRALATETLHRAASLPPDFDYPRWFDTLYAEFALPRTWAVFPDVIPALDALRPRARLAVISNFDTRLRAILSGHGLLSRFEHIVISSEAGCEKPHPSIFRHALHLMRVPPSLCLHVGDDPVRDWAAAEALGIRSFRLRRPAHSLLHLAAGE